MQLARAGFFYQPTEHSHDNVKCFKCGVTLNAWEETDNAVEEHIGHSSNCGYATAISVSRGPEDLHNPENRDPMSDIMVAARQSTFTFGEGWPHESKKGWKCKIDKMVEAGWSWDPNPNVDEDNDGVTCFYCDLSLDGWEPKDDPLQEHKRRSPHCRFFELLEQSSRTSIAGKSKKASKRGKPSIRSSTASKASRLSAQSNVGELPDTAGSDSALDFDGNHSTLDESSLSTATTQTKPSGKAKGKQRRPKATAKNVKTEEITLVEAGERVDVSAQYPDLREHDLRSANDEVESLRAAHDSDMHFQDTSPPGIKVKASRSANLGDDRIDVVAPKKTGRGRKAQSQEKPQLEHSLQTIIPETAPPTEGKPDEVANQLLVELEYSMEEPAEGESTTIEETAKPRSGTKRMSDGRSKGATAGPDATQAQPADDPDNRPAVPIKRGRKPKANNSEAHEDISGARANITKGSKQTRKGKTAKGSREPSMTEESSSAGPMEVVVMSKQDLLVDHDDADEAEIEIELQRIADEEILHSAVAMEHGLAAEFEPSPLQDRISKGSQEIRDLEREIEEENRRQAAARPATIAFHSRPFDSPNGSDKENKLLDSSPQYSDKENEPKSAARSLMKNAMAATLRSPSKTSKVPLALETPNRSPLKTWASPNKQISHLSTTVPWSAVDLDLALTASPQPTPGRLSQQLAAAAGVLTSPEKAMSVEEWVRYRAEQSEADLRRRCEQKVAAFETEGLRALQSLGGINVLA
jgi:hypothetical protein